MNAIEIKNLTKNFGEKQALVGLDMTVPVGSIYGFIGENGSGKSTLIKVIMNEQTLPVEGKIEVGPSVKIGYLPQIINFEKVHSRYRRKQQHGPCPGY